MCLLSFFISVFVMCFIHEPLGQISMAASIPRYDFNKLIDCLNDRAPGSKSSFSQFSLSSHCGTETHQWAVIASKSNVNTLFRYWYVLSNSFVSANGRNCNF